MVYNTVFLIIPCVLVSVRDWFGFQFSIGNSTLCVS